jgi:hypothetical protein
MRLYPGQVFSAPHLDIDTGKLMSHFFVCIYTQELDSSLPEGLISNVKGLLIGSRPSDSRYLVPLSNVHYPFLRNVSYCYTDKEAIFSKDNIQFIGVLLPQDFINIVNARLKVHYSELFQCQRSIENITLGQSKKFSKLLNSHLGGDSK